MAPNGLLHPGCMTSNHLQPIIQLPLLLTLVLIFPAGSYSQETTGFKPSTSNGEKSGGSGAAVAVGKVVEFITGNPNQRSLPNNSQSQSYADLYTRGLGNYIGGGGGGGGGTSISTGQYFPQNFGPFAGGGYQGSQFGIGGGGNKGIPYPGVPYPFPLGQFPGFNQHPGGVGKPPFPQVPQQQYPFNPNPPLAPPGGYFQQGFAGAGGSGFPGYPYPGGGGAGNLFLGFPKQVRVPGRIEISLNGNGLDADIICEFPRFLILIQKVYWHHKYDDPYGTFYDSSNRFGPRVTVATPDKWKSILTIHNYNEDDYGTYRCLTAAILPDESSSSYVDNRGQYLLRSPSTTTETSVTSLQQQDFLTRQKIPVPEKSKTRNGKDMKFPPSANTNRVTRKIRFSRSTISNPVLETSASGRNLDYNRIDAAINSADGTPGTIGPKAGPGENFDLTKQGSEEVYDPYYFQRHQDQESPTARNYFQDYNSLHHGPGGPYSTSTLPSNGGGHPYHSQDHRYNPLVGGGYAGAGGGQQNFPQPGNPGYGGGNFGPYAPYYKPSYGIFTIYQEIKFDPPPHFRRGNTSSRSNSVKL